MGPLVAIMEQNPREAVDLSAVSRVDRGNQNPRFGMAGPRAILSLPYAKGYR